MVRFIFEYYMHCPHCFKHQSPCEQMVTAITVKNVDELLDGKHKCETCGGWLDFMPGYDRPAHVYRDQWCGVQKLKGIE